LFSHFFFKDCPNFAFVLNAFLLCITVLMWLV
jgi:hypothetical protein